MAAPKITRGSFRGLAGSSEKTERTRLILMMPRSFRPEYELIIEEIENNEEVFSIYLRPRSDREEIEQAGFDSNFHSMHLIDIAIKDLGIWMKPLVSNGWTRSEIDTSPTSNCDFPTFTWTCFKHPGASNASTILLPFDPLDFTGKCFTYPSNGDNNSTDIEETIEETVEEKIEPEVEENNEDDVVEVIAEENLESPLKVEVRQTIEMLKADGLDMTGIMEHPKFLDVSERASVAGIDVWTMVVGMFQ